MTIRVSRVLALLMLASTLASTQGLAQVPQPPILLPPVTGGPQCSNGIDDDHDGKIDFPTDGKPYTGTGDDGCWDPTDNDEAAGLPHNADGTRYSTSNTGECSSRTLSIPGNTYNNCDFGTGDLTIAAANIVIENSIIRGSIRPTSTTNANTLTIRYSDIIGAPVSTAGMLETTKGSTLLDHVRGRGFTWMLYVNSGTVLDSTLYDLCAPSDWHIESVLTSGSGVLDIQRTWLNNNGFDHPSCTAGSASAVVAMYSHSSGGWADTSNKKLINNRIQMEDAKAWYFIYFGRTCAERETPQNMIFTGNVLAGASHGSGWLPTAWGWYRSSSNTWSNNVRGIPLTTTSLNGAAYNEADVADCY